MRETVMRFQGMPKGIEKISVGWPLLTTNEDMQRAAEAVLKNIPQERKKNEAVVLMGHGTHHPGNVYYPAYEITSSRRWIPMFWSVRWRASRK